MKKKILTYVGIALLFLVFAYGFVPQVLSGKIVNQSDISGYVGMSHEMSRWNKANPSDQTAWTGSMFGGMPTAAIHSSTKGDWTQKIYDVLLTGRRPATYLFISLVGAFLLLLSLGVNPLIAAGGAVAVTFCAYNIQIIQVGHNTKMQAIAFMPWVLAAVIFTYRCSSDRKRWLPGTLLGAALFALALSFQVKANHPQISWYLAVLIFIYVVVLFVSIIRGADRGEGLRRFSVASALLLVLGCAGIATNATKFLPTWEYTPYSMRGGSSSGETKGLDLDYATAWSYGWEELPNLFIPDFNGGSSSGAIDPDRSETVALLKKYGQGSADQIASHLPLYWGPQPFTAGPMYMGAVSILLFVLGLMFLKGKERWWVIIATVFAILLAVGNHFLWFTRLCYEGLPLYNKFRTVSMALVVLQITIPVLGFKLLDDLVKDDALMREFKSRGWIALAMTGGFCLLFILFPSLAGTFSGASDAGQPDALVSALEADRKMLLVRDALRSLVFVSIAWGVIFWGCSNRSSGVGRRALAAMLVCALALVDVFSVGKRYLTDEDFVSPKAFNSQFKQRPVDKMILEDKDPSYRVLDLTVNVFNDSHPSYWHKNIGGYSPAKLQLYQEYIDSHLSGEINKLYKSLSGASTIADAENALPELEGLSKLNCRYIILGDEYPPLRYPFAKGNAWFADGGGSIKMDSYAPNCLKYSYSSDNGGKAVFSEVYYPAGWKLVLDGEKELEMSLSDELFRSAVLPAGSHSLEMRFAPESYVRGEAVSRGSSIFIILLVLLAAAFAWRSDCHQVLKKAD